MPDAFRSTSEGGLERVAYLANLDPSRKFGSLEEQALLMARAFQERGSCFLPVFSSPLRGEALREYAAAGVAAETLDLSRLDVDRLRSLLALLRRERIDAVHWSFYYPANPYVWLLSALRPRLRHYFTDHNSRYPQTAETRGLVRSALKTALLARFDRIVCVSDFVAESLRREGVRSRRITPCPHFINTERFRPDARERARIRGELGARSRFVVLLVAHLIAEKGAAVLLEAAARLPAEIVLWIAGDGPESERLHRQAEELGIEGRVVFLGDCGKVQPYMQAADCLVCPSLWEEAAGLVNLEGLACGLPVVASRIGGIPEIVEHGRTGLLVPSGDADALAAAIQLLWKEPETRARMGAEAREAALARYAPERRLPQFLDLYRRRPGGLHVR